MNADGRTFLITTHDRAIAMAVARPHRHHRRRIDRRASSKEVSRENRPNSTCGCGVGVPAGLDSGERVRQQRALTPTAGLRHDGSTGRSHRPDTHTGPRPRRTLVRRPSVERVLVGARFKLTLDIENATSRRAENVVVSLRAVVRGIRRRGRSRPGGGLSVLGIRQREVRRHHQGQGDGVRHLPTSWQVREPPPGRITVPVIISFEYNGERQEITHTIGIVVERDATFSLVTAELPDESVVGETFDASFEMANASGFALSAVTLSVEASGAVRHRRTNLPRCLRCRNHREQSTCSITPEKAGTLEVVLVVTYRDDFGRTQEFRESPTVRRGSRQAEGRRGAGAAADRRISRERPTRSWPSSWRSLAWARSVRFRDLTFLVVSNLRRMKLRLALTALGVVIGTSAIVLMVSLGVGLQRSVIASLGDLGAATHITVMGGGELRRAASR